MRPLSKKVKDSIITMTELVLPNHANELGNLLGGQLMHWIDICAALSANKHSNGICVTASVDKIDFHKPVRVGDAVTLISSVNRVFNTSMEIGVKVYAECFKAGTHVHANSAYLTFVALDENRKPTKVIPVIPETKDQKRRYEEALIRRNTRLETLRRG